MSQQQYLINFTYKSPDEDFLCHSGFNSNGSINIKYTLTAMRDKLLQNVEIIEKLLEKHDQISDLTSIGYGLIRIEIKDQNHIESLRDGGLIKNFTDIQNENQDDSLDIFQEDIETNQERLSMITNFVINQDNKFDDPYDSDESSSSDILDDTVRHKMTREFCSKSYGMKSCNDNHSECDSSSDQ